MAEYDSRPLRAAARRTGYNMRKQKLIDWCDLCTLVTAAFEATDPRVQQYGGRRQSDEKGAGR